MFAGRPHGPAHGRTVLPQQLRHQPRDDGHADGRLHSELKNDRDVVVLLERSMDKSMGVHVQTSCFACSISSQA